MLSRGSVFSRKEKYQNLTVSVQKISLYSDDILARYMQMGLTFLYGLIPAIGMFIGSVTGFRLNLSKNALSYLQHFTSGLVFAAVAIELLPKISPNDSRWTVALGFILGALLMLFLKWFTGKSTSLALKYAVGIDIFIDGMLIGIAFIAGTSSGLIITLAFSIEMVNLGLSTAPSMFQKGDSSTKKMIAIFLLSLCLPLGALSSTLFVSLLPSSIFTETLSFGVAALLYLVTEELLLEAHTIKESPWVTSLFFLGFLFVIMTR